MNIFGIRKTTTTEQFRPSFEPEANQNPLLYNNATPATLDQLPLRTKDCNIRNMDDYEKNIIDMFQTFSSQQDKRFREMLTNINTTRQDMFQNLSNQQEVRFRELLTDLNCARQEIYQTVSIQQEKCFKELLTSLNSARQNMFQELSNQQDKRFNDLITSLQSTRDEVCQLLYDQREKQFEELLSNVNRIKVEKETLSNTFNNLSSKYDEVLLRLQKTDAEKRDGEENIQRLQKKLDILERRLSLSTMKLRNIPKINKYEFETKEDLCKFIIKLGKSHCIRIEMSNIRDAYRENSEESSASIVVEFTTVLMKEALHSALTKTLKEESKSEQLNTTLDYYKTPASFLFLSVFVFISSFYFLSLFLIYF
ncbi:unnamed protein product [Arctia plantaginis]|uniref:Uncharacterized protein n=1 Tax=Arctia plantaginis TaxID=874455 RepID=A0A8S1BQR7_ARCPL|nr:unnamed protein product [Arctia plantaginis]